MCRFPAKILNLLSSCLVRLVVKETVSQKKNFFSVVLNLLVCWFLLFWPAYCRVVIFKKTLSSCFIENFLNIYEIFLKHYSKFCVSLVDFFNVLAPLTGFLPMCQEKMYFRYVVFGSMFRVIYCFKHRSWARSLLLGFWITFHRKKPLLYTVLLIALTIRQPRVSKYPQDTNRKYWFNFMGLLVRLTL